MFKHLLLVMALVLAVLSPEARAGQNHISLAPLVHSFAPPPLARKQGWLVISNHDWQDYSLGIDPNNHDLYLYRRGEGWGSVEIPSGNSVTLALEKSNWSIRGNSSDRLRVRVREGLTGTVALEPFGYVGNTGLTGVSNSDNERATLFDAYAPAPVIVQPPVIVQQPPVIVRPPPVVVVPSHRPPPPHRPQAPPPPPQRGKDKKKWGFSLFFD
ncbi:MAG: hypothetical protein LBU79_03435 [Planctomycetota bacterium]|nr:hypothetical protein [Planctomycetota bacterium]